MGVILLLRVSRWDTRAAVAVLALSMTAAVAAPAAATLKYGPLQLSGSLETQNLVRSSSPTEWQFVQNRNTFRARVDWDWLQSGRLIDKIEIPFIERSKLFLLYRGVYDGFYDIAPTELQHGETRFDDIVGGRITDVRRDQRSAVKFENTLREAYIELKVRDAPLTFRLGRQQVVWGQSDQFRLMDIWNPLDVTWHFQQEPWDNIRIPLWLGKGVWDLGDFGPVSSAFVEVVYNAFDFEPGVKAAFLPRPWAFPFPDPLRRGQVQQVSPTLPGLFISPFFDLQGTNFRHGDFERNPQDASEAGIRVHGGTQQGAEFTVNYLYGRSRGIGANAPFAVRIDKIVVPGFSKGNAIPGATFLGRQVFPAQVAARVVHPYVHIFGLTGNYFDGDVTETAFRFETAYALGEPNQTKQAAKRVNVVDSSGDPLGFKAPIGFTKRDVWAGMIGFDRPTWIRWLNSTATWFLSGQFFWSYTTGNTDFLVGSSGAGEVPYFTPRVGPGSDTQGVGMWKGGPFDGQTERLQDASFAGNADNIRRWEHLATIAATSQYRGGTLVPFVANAWDPVNNNLEVMWSVDYFYGSDFIITLGQRFFTDFGSNVPSNDPWFSGGRFHRRDETGIKLTYQF